MINSQDLLDRINLFDMDASLKVSFMAGLIEIEGSASYLNDQRKYKESVRVTRAYNAEGQDQMVDTVASIVNR